MLGGAPSRYRQGREERGKRGELRQSRADKAASSSGISREVDSLTAFKQWTTSPDGKEKKKEKGKLETLH